MLNNYQNIKVWSAYHYLVLRVEALQLKQRKGLCAGEVMGFILITLFFGQ